MNRRTRLCLVGLMGLVGCTGPQAPVANSDATTSVQSSSKDSAAATFVTLKVPNMH